MANSLYDAGRQGFADGSFSWPTSSICVAAVSSAYTPALASDEFLSDIPSSAILGTSVPLTGKTDAAGVLRAYNAALLDLPPTEVFFLVLYADFGLPTASRLIGVIDTASGLPFTPVAGGSVTIVWDSGANGILKL